MINKCAVVTHQSLTVMDELLRCFTQVEVAILQYKKDY